MRNPNNGKERIADVAESLSCDLCRMMTRRLVTGASRRNAKPSNLRIEKSENS